MILKSDLCKNIFKKFFFLNNIWNKWYVPQTLPYRSCHRLWDQRLSTLRATALLRGHRFCRDHFETMRGIWDQTPRWIEIRRRLYRRHWNMRPCLSALLLADYLFPGSICLINTQISVSPWLPFTPETTLSNLYLSMKNTAVSYI